MKFIYFTCYLLHCTRIQGCAPKVLNESLESLTAVVLGYKRPRLSECVVLQKQLIRALAPGNYHIRFTQELINVIRCFAADKIYLKEVGAFGITLVA